MKGRLWTSVYLVVLLWPVPGFLGSGPSGVTAGLMVAGLASFAALYLRVVWTALDHPHRNATPYSLILLFLVAAAMVPVLGEMWVFATSYFLITAAATALPVRALPAVGGAVVVAIVPALLLLGKSPAEFWWMPLQTVVFTVAMRAFLQLNAANKALSEANVEVERLAVDNERLRFARDMHDLLGHRLAVMTVKSQLAARLATADPERARAEMEEVEELSRQALSDVREAIGGYREPSLPGELDGARRALGTAGVRLDVGAGPVPADAEPVLAWVVREATTNVVRHSGARHCRIRLGVEDGQAYAEVYDDGRGPADTPGTPDACGNGLRGLAERVHVAGGALHCGPAEGGGFLLTARLPIFDGHDGHDDHGGHGRNDGHGGSDGHGDRGEYGDRSERGRRAGVAEVT
ncbi:sensor histidine kinase [Nonomuraea mesophila]|uniref:Sensor histidine kinase n=1 Tax=Nonomuraea mesophila TaxID=2530382 RepID=A0A4V2ZBW5_9ACTN|nr:sensor histidine kinase [Nonomuraea mesophila]TDE59738.1 sensor histidine kinase [Nonomuraea mesophila]